VIKASGYVRLDVTSPFGCIASDSIMLTAKPCCQVTFPNAFSPNNDGRNDFFHPITIGHHNINNFRIMNRWGQVVYESKDETKGWNGTFNGKEQPIGSYYYYIKYLCKQNEYLEQKGEFLLLR